MLIRPHLVVIKSLAKTYIDEREINNETSLLGTANYFYSTLTNQPNSPANVKTTFDTIHSKCSQAHHATNEEQKAKLWTMMLISLGEKAFIAQSYSKNPSKLCETLHAIRFYILGYAEVFPELKTEIEKQIALLHQSMEAKNNEISTAKINNVEDKSLKKLEEAHDEISRQLFYLGDSKHILHFKKEEINSLFPHLEFPKLEKTPVATLSDEKQHNPTQFVQTLPFIFQHTHLNRHISLHFKKENMTNIKELETYSINTFCQAYGISQAAAIEQYCSPSTAFVQTKKDIDDSSSESEEDETEEKTTFIKNPADTSSNSQAMMTGMLKQAALISPPIQEAGVMHKDKTLNVNNVAGNIVNPETTITETEKSKKNKKNKKKKVTNDTNSNTDQAVRRLV